ncbi:carboxymuconolactone decarboxylase family protein [Nonomuraea sp. NPDC052265]|uniref:carboxymuconolactone decarboxylase family protein n=1 Tax=Nonomuraea sp. NPDC052265 TaxID=3364374 RepID=UPI0037C93A17
MSFRHVVPVPRRSATGRVAEVYAQSTADFGQAAFMMLSPAPELHAAAWAMLRESELAGLAPRTDKEVVAVAVSQANGCRFCIDAHTILIHALGEHQLAEDLLDDRVPTYPHAVPFTRNSPGVTACHCWPASRRRHGRPGPATHRSGPRTPPCAARQPPAPRSRASQARSFSEPRSPNSSPPARSRMARG